MIYLIILFVFFIFVIPLKVELIVNLSYYEIKFYRLKIYHRNYKDISDISKERKQIKYLKIFKLIDIQSINIEVSGFNDYFFESISYGLIYFMFNIFSFIIQDPYIFNYSIKSNKDIDLKFNCIIKSNLGKIIMEIFKRRRKRI